MSKIQCDNRCSIDLRFPIKGLTELDYSVPKINRWGNSFKRCGRQEIILDHNKGWLYYKLTQGGRIDGWIYLKELGKLSL